VLDDFFSLQTETTFVYKLQKSRLPKLHLDFPWKNPTNFAEKNSRRLLPVILVFYSSFFFLIKYFNKQLKKKSSKAKNIIRRK